MRKFLIIWGFRSHRREQDFSDSVIVEESDAFYAKESFMKNKDKDHFFIKAVLDISDIFE